YSFILVARVSCVYQSDDDLGGTISPSGNPDAYLHHNTFIKREGVPFVRAHMDGGKFTEEENEIREI
ncbi:MAG: hypothetical protein K1W40_12800, partial [Schaedlerella sp.]